jgi:hypothetical protein
MNRAVCCIVILLFANGLMSQTVALPGKTGWVVYSDGQQNPVKDKVVFIGLFDSHKLAPFSGYNEMGVIDQKGNVLYRVEAKIEALDHGFFSVGDSMLVQIANGVSRDYAVKLFKNYEQWVIGSMETKIVAINKSSGKIIDINSVNYKVINGYLFCTISETNYLYDSGGKLVDKTSRRSSNSFEKSDDYCNLVSHTSGDILVWFTPRQKLLLIDGQQFSIEKARRIAVLKEHIEIVESKHVHLFDLKTKRITMTAQGEMLRPVGSEHVIFQLNNKMGLLNRAGKTLIPADYDNITLFKQYALVRKDQLTGLYDRDFVRVLDCNFTRIEPRYNFYYTQKFGGRGLVSRKTNKELLAPVYDRILIKDNKIKAWLGNQLRILVIDENHKIVDEYILNNVVSVDKATYIDASIEYDPRLFQIGWFHVSKEFKNEKGSTAHRLLWGLKDEQDSIILSPSLPHIRYVHESPVSLYPLPERDHPYNKYSYGGINNASGKIIPKLVVLDIDTNDFQRRNFARFSAPDFRHGILKRDCQFELYAYIDRGDASLLRVCKSGAFNFLDNGRASQNSVPIINKDLNGFMPYTRYVIDKKSVSHIAFDKAKWNFLNADGACVFENDFEFAFPYVGKHAIVKTDTGFGLVDTANFVIEPVYKSIKRVFYNGDTLFVVEEKPKGATLFQFSYGILHNLSIHNVNVQKKRDLVTLLATANQKHVIHEELGLLQDSMANVKLYQHGYFVERVKKQFFIYNHEGELLCETELRPKNILNDALFIFQDKGLLALCHVDQGKISEAKYQSIQLRDAFVFCQSRTGVDIHDPLGNLLATGLENIQLDPVSGNLLYVSKGKMYVVDAAFKPVRKMKYIDLVLAFVDNKVYLRSGQILDSQGKEVTHRFGNFEEVHYLGEEVLSISAKNESPVLCDLNWNPIELGVEKIKKPMMLDDNLIQFHAKDRVYLFNKSSGALTSVKDVYGGFQDDLICVRLHDQVYAYLNRELENPFNMTFKRAKPFRGGFAAVEFESGWGIINSAAILQIAPCLNEITILSRDLVLSNAHSQLGVLDGLGREIVPIKYDAIVFQKDYIKVHNYGKIEIWNTKFQKILESDAFGLAQQ